VRAVENSTIRLFVFDTSVNLLAPIVVNVHMGACAQVILDDQDWPLQAELATRSA
jgi:flagellar assembly factor FliW